MTTERSVRERFAIRVLRSADRALRSTDGELVRGLSTEVRPNTDLHALDSERTTGNTKVGPEISRFIGKQETPLVLPHLAHVKHAHVKQEILGDVGSGDEVRRRWIWDRQKAGLILYAPPTASYLADAFRTDSLAYEPCFIRFLGQIGRIRLESL